MSAEALCIIPARGGSKRFPRKNLASIAGRPLVAQAVRVAVASGLFRTVCVSSDSDEVLEVARAHGANLLSSRSAALSSDDAQVKDVCLSVIETLAGQAQHYDTFAVLLPTSPLRTAQDLREAYRLLAETGADCCMSVTPFEHPPQRAVWMPEGKVVPYFGGDQMRPTQALDALYRHDGTVIVARTGPFVRDPRFYGPSVVPYVVPAERAVDVDRPVDLAWADFLVRSGAVQIESLLESR